VAATAKTQWGETHARVRRAMPIGWKPTCLLGLQHLLSGAGRFGERRGWKTVVRPHWTHWTHPLDPPVALYRYIAAAASPQIAERYTGAIVIYCGGLQTFPRRGIRRDDIRPGLRITNHRKRTVIAFDVDTKTVSIVGVFYGGQDYETMLEADLDG
jgi:toxin ParE1/3/4